MVSTGSHSRLLPTPDSLRPDQQGRIWRRTSPAAARPESGSVYLQPGHDLVFDEVDAGVGGATAASVAEPSRLSGRCAGAGRYALAQVAARGSKHFHVRKSIAESTEGSNTTTAVMELSDEERREEIARMLAGAKITEEARAAADSLIAEMAQ